MRRWTWSGWLARIVGALLVVAVLGYVAVSVIAADELSRPKRIALVGTPADLGLTYEPVEFTSEVDNVPLRGWWMPVASSDRAVVIVHGRDSSRTADNGELTQQAQGLVKAGYNVLTFDLRAHGESGGTRYSFGPFERRDVLAAVAFVRGRGIPAGHVGLLCHSMGAATCLLSAPQAPDVSAVVSDSAYARFSDLLTVQFPKRGGLPLFFLPGTLFMANALYGIDVRQAAPIEVVAAIRPRPVFFIHGASDTYVPPENAQLLWTASGEAATMLWMVPGVEHDRAYRTNPEEYLRRVVTFLDAHEH
jgi:alpha-beta hydrolase superfamily lysophospholipase